MLEYDRRKGWRGPIKNIKYDDNWHKNLDRKYELENSINWEIAIVKEIGQFQTKIETVDKLSGIIKYNEISWTKKDFEDLLKVGDLIYVKKVKDNYYSLKQLPKIKELGFSDSFINLWEFYFVYCEAGFKEKNIGDYQFVFSKKEGLK